MTTGQVAKLLGTSPKTVTNWFTAGLFPGSYRLPAGDGHGDGDRRFPAGCVVAFCRRRGMPVPQVLLAAVRPGVVLVGGLAGLRWPDGFGADVWAGPVLEAVHRAGRVTPDAVVLGCDDGLSLAADAARVILDAGGPATPAVALVLSEDADPWDGRLDGVRSRLCFLGRLPPDHTEVIRTLRLDESDGREGEHQGAG